MSEFLKVFSFEDRPNVISIHCTFEFILLAKFVAYNFYFIPILDLGLCMLYHNFHCTFSCYLPSTKIGLRYTDMGCPVTLALSKEPDRVGISPSP
jgi:hypothetical protein